MKWNVQICDATKRYGDNTLFEGLTLALEPGKAIRLQGPNGSGKTQFIYCLLGAVEMDRGRIAAVSERGRVWPQEFVAYLPYSLDSARHLTTGDVALARSGVSLFGLLLTTQASGRRNALKSALSIQNPAQVQDQMLGHLSFGQAKLALIDVLCSQTPGFEAPVIILDEPLAGLSEAARSSVLEKVEAARKRGSCIIVAEHDQSIATLGFDQSVTFPFRSTRRISPRVYRQEIQVATAARSGSLVEIVDFAGGYHDFQVHCPRMHIRHGELTVIRGDNGAGKSAFLRAMMGQAGTECSGSIVIAGRRVANLGEVQKERLAWYVDQHRSSFSDLKVSEAVSVAARTLPMAPLIQEALSLLGREKRVSTLSAGNRALLATVEAASSGAAVCFLDEPFANADGPTSLLIGRLLGFMLARGSAIVMIEHRELPLAVNESYRIVASSNGQRTMEYASDLSTYGR